MWSCKKGLNLKKNLLLIITLLLFLLIASSACQLKHPIPSVEPTSGPTEEINPLTLLSYIEEVKLYKTERIEFTHPQTKQQIVISYQVTIQAVVDLLKSTPESCEVDINPVENGLLVLMLIPNSKAGKVVSVDFLPDENLVKMDNVPTGSWPFKIYGTYSVCPDFGLKLFEVLGL